MNFSRFNLQAVMIPSIGTFAASAPGAFTFQGHGSRVVGTKPTGLRHLGVSRLIFDSLCLRLYVCSCS
jgi:hypothetical protein